MKLFLKGGTCIEVSLKDHTLVMSDLTFSVYVNNSLSSDSPWTKCSNVETITLPVSYIEKIEL